MTGVGYPRLMRSTDGRPIWDQGPLGMSAVLSALPMPERWQLGWPEPPLSEEVASELLQEWRMGWVGDRLGCSVASAVAAETEMVALEGRPLGHVLPPHRVEDITALYRSATGGTLSFDAEDVGTEDATRPGGDARRAGDPKDDRRKNG